METLVVIDGNSLINRAFYAMPPLTNSDGTPTQAVFGFATMLNKLIQDYRPDRLAVTFDLPGKTFRHKRFDGYKATRKGMPEDLAVQLPLLKTMLRLMDIRIVECAGYEADDLIGALAAAHTGLTYIVTGDRDALQLVDETTQVILTKRGITETVTVTPDTIVGQFGMRAAQIVEYKALAGDSSDNIPGVAGVGEKTALDLLARFDTLDGIYAHIDEITGKLKERLIENRETAYLSRELATIDRAAPLCVAPGDCAYSYPFPPAVKQFFITNNFRTLLKRDELFASGADVPAEAPVTTQSVCETRKITDIDALRSVLALPHTSVAFLAYPHEIRVSTGDCEYVIPLRLSLLDEGLDEGQVFPEFAGLLRDTGVQKLLFDAKSLMRRMIPYGIVPERFNDLKLMRYLADVTAETETPELILETYGLDKAAPASGMFALFDLLGAEIDRKEMRRLYEEIELPLVRILFDMECAGVKIDVALLDALGTQYVRQANALSTEIYALSGRMFNINSPKQLAAVLFDELQIPYPKRSKKYSTAVEILSQIEDKHPIVRLIGQYRSVTKLNGTYIEGLKRLLDADGVIHTEFKQLLTATGRLSSAEPNLQNIPVREEEGRVLRGLFVARENRTLVCADYSQIELRLLAHFSKDPKMLEIYARGEDIHAITAAEVFGVPPGEVTSEMRRRAKTVNFGIIYGMGDYGLAQRLKCPVYEAKAYIDTYFHKFPAIRAYFERVVEDAKQTGLTKSLLGRVRKIPELASANHMTRQFGERAAMNMPLQASAADIIKIAMVRVYARLNGMRSKLILQIHDELIIEAEDDERDEVIAILREGMEGAVSLDVPLTVSIKSGKSWLDCE